MRRRTGGGGVRVLMLLENNPYRHDPRVRREAESLARAGYGVTVICPKGAETRRIREIVDEGVVLYQYRASMGGGGLRDYVIEYGYSLVAMLFLSLIAVVREGFDVVHAHNPPDTLVMIAGPYRLFGKRFVFDHHDLSPEMYDARYGGKANRRVRRLLEWFERLTFRSAHLVISTNDSYRQVAISRGGVDPDRVIVVRNGPDLDDEAMAPPAPSKDGDRGTVLGYVGIMGPQDGVELLLEAVALVVARHGRSDVSCVLVGKGDSVPGLETLAASLGIADKVTFTGWVPSADVPGLVSGFDICLDPDPSNPYNDRCTMIKMMEYMAAAKPIVAFDLPEHRVTAGDAAVYASDNDVTEYAALVVDLIDDPDRRHRMGQVGRQRIVERFAWSHQEARLIAAYDAMASGGGPHRVTRPT